LFLLDSSFVYRVRQPTDNQYRNAQDTSDAGMSSMAANFFKTARDELVSDKFKRCFGNRLFSFFSPFTAD